MTARVNRPHLKTGAKPKPIPSNAATRIEKLAASGHSVVGIARGLSTSKDLLAKWMDQDPALAAALERGRESERFDLHNVLYRAAQKGNIVAAMFLLKARHGYKEGDQSDSANKVSITFSLPGALKPEEFEKVIEHEQPAITPLQIPTKIFIRPRRV